MAAPPSVTVVDRGYAPVASTEVHATPPPRVVKRDGLAGKPAEVPPFLRPQPPTAGPAKRGIMQGRWAQLAVASVPVLAVAWFIWSSEQKPKSGAAVQPAPVEQGSQTPAQPSPAPAPPDRELTRMRNAVVRAVRAKDWPKVGPLINNLLAQYPADADALEWRYLLTYGRKSDLFAKLNPNAGTPAGQDITGAEQLLQQGEYAAAIAVFQHVLASDPGNARARDGLKRATDAKASADATFAKQGAAELANREQLLQLADGEQLLQQGDYAGAIASFNRVLAGDPNNAGARDVLKKATDAKAAEDRVFGKQ